MCDVCMTCVFVYAFVYGVIVVKSLLFFYSSYLETLVIKPFIAKIARRFLIFNLCGGCD